MHGKSKIKWEIVITIIISIIGLYVSWQMYNIAKLQTTIAKNSFLPNIIVTEKQKNRFTNRKCNRDKYRNKEYRGKVKEL